MLNKRGAEPGGAGWPEYEWGRKGDLNEGNTVSRMNQPKPCCPCEATGKITPFESFVKELVPYVYQPSSFSFRSIGGNVVDGKRNTSMRMYSRTNNRTARTTLRRVQWYNRTTGVSTIRTIVRRYRRHQRHYSSVRRRYGQRSGNLTNNASLWGRTRSIRAHAMGARLHHFRAQRTAPGVPDMRMLPSGEVKWTHTALPPGADGGGDRFGGGKCVGCAEGMAPL